MILDKLIEKKDLELYCIFRIEELKIEKKKIEIQLADNTLLASKKKTLQRAKLKICGRITEIKKLRSNLIGGHIKRESKRMWKKVVDDEILVHGR